MSSFLPKLALAVAVTIVGAARAAPPDASLRSSSDRTLYQSGEIWTDDTGQAMRLATLRGHPVVLAMFYTQCRYACPMIVAAMRRIEAALPAAERENARFVLVSFDSEHDTPAALHAYRQAVGLAPGAWILAHGDPAAVRELAMVLGVKYQRLGEGQYAHSNLITVLNDRGEIAYQRIGLEGDVRAAVDAVTQAAR